MHKWSLWAAGYLGAGLLLGALTASLVQVRSDPPGQTPEFEPDPVVFPTPPAKLQTAEVELEPDPQQELIRTQAADLVRRFMNVPWPELNGTEWSRRYTSEAEILVDGVNTNAWITVSSARVPCEKVDAVLVQSEDPDLGPADRCTRWLRAATETMRRHGIENKTPQQFLEELGAERNVRVMVVYAGWSKDPNENDAIRLVEARPVFVYPQASYKEKRDDAQNEIFRAMKLGPYADASAHQLPANTLVD